MASELVPSNQARSLLIDSLDDSDWIHEVVRNNAIHLAENIHVNDELLDLIKASHILSDEEQANLRRVPTALNALNILVEKEVPSVWKPFCEILPEAKRIHKTVVEEIYKLVNALKKNPSNVIKPVERRKTSEMHQDSARLVYLLLGPIHESLVRYFCILMENRFGSLGDAYHSEAFRNAIENHVEGIRNCPTMLQEHQECTIRDSYLERDKIKQFNFSLLISLIAIFSKSPECNNVQDPLATLRKIRDMVYKDMITKGTPKLNFGVCLKEIQEIVNVLERTVGESRDFKYLTDKCFDILQINELKRRLTLCIDNDLLSKRDFFEKYDLILSYKNEIFPHSHFSLNSVENMGDIQYMHKHMPPEFREQFREGQNETKICMKLEEMKQQQTLLIRNIHQAIRASHDAIKQTNEGLDEIKQMIQSKQEAHNLVVLQDLMKQHDVPCDFGSMITYRGAQDEPVTWIHVRRSDILEIYEQIDKRRRQNIKLLLACNFRDMVTIMIYRARSDDGIDNIGTALEWTKSWKRQYPNDINSEYMHGVLLFSRSIQSPSYDLLVDAKLCFKKCQQLTEGYKPPKMIEFFIGRDEGLKTLIPSDTSPAIGTLRLFEGRVVSGPKVICSQFEPMLEVYLDTTRISPNLLDEQPVVTYNLRIGIDGIFAVNARKKATDWPTINTP